jgi:hypothetical protein
MCFTVLNTQQKCDLFAVGIIFLEIITLREAHGLYDLFYPSILQKNIPTSLKVCLESSLEEDPISRTSFRAMYEALTSDYSTFEDKNSVAIKMLEEGVDEILANRG